MGASGSKAAQQTARKFPTRAPGSSPAAAAVNRTARAPPRAPPGPSADPQPRSQPQASYTKDDAIRADSTNPDRPDFSSDFAERLQKMGIVQPNPTYSPSSIANPYSDASGIKQSLSTPQFPSSRNNATLGVLEARRQLESRARQELENRGKSTDKGKELLDVGTIKRILLMRQSGTSTAEIESRLRLKPGVVARLGPRGVVAPAS